MSEQSEQSEDWTKRRTLRESFAAVVAKAREVLEERGLSEDEIEFELHRSTRDEQLSGPPAAQADTRQ